MYMPYVLRISIPYMQAVYLRCIFTPHVFTANLLVKQNVFVLQQQQQQQFVFKIGDHIFGIVV